MRNALAALALTDIAEELPARPARAARPVLPARKSGAQGYTTGDILAMLIEVGALEDLGLTDRLKSRPVAVPADGRGHAVDRLL